MSKKMMLIFILLLSSFFISIFFVAVSFSKIKYRYSEIEPNLDNYSAGEILSLSFEKAKVSLLRGDVIGYRIKINIFLSKIKIMENRFTLSDFFYHSPSFLSNMAKLKKQYDELKKLNDKLFNQEVDSSVIINYMDEMDITIIELLEVIYQKQINNFNEVKEIINGNFAKAQWFSITSMFLVFFIFFLAVKNAIYLRDLLRKKNLFISSIYHELASSTQTIVISADIIENEIMQDDLKVEAKRISRHTNKIIEQTREIFDYSKIELGVASVNISSFILFDMFRDVIEYFSEVNNNQFIVKSHNKSVTLQSDKYKIYRVVMNLVDNSNKNTFGGFVYLNYRVYKGNLLLRVRDTGSGFDLKDINSLYQAFNQGAENRTKQGLGLGLTIIKSYVKILGGKIKVKAEVGIGSSFLVLIPVVLVEK